MKLFASLDARDRKLLIGCLIGVLVLAFVTAFFSRNENSDDNPVPSTYLTGRHGARAAYELLQASSYNVERWEQPLSDLAERANDQTVVIFAGPNQADITAEDSKAVRDIVARGGRVLVTGWVGGSLAPDGNVQPPTQFDVACKLTPQGLDPLAGSGEVWMVPEAGWGTDRPLDRVEYNCAGTPAVVEYAEGKGKVIWWASSTPLENGTIGRANNLNLFLNRWARARITNSIGTNRCTANRARSGSMRAGRQYLLLRGGLFTIGVAGSSSVSAGGEGRCATCPFLSRATPVEFLEALGSLYAEARASATAVDLAYERFRRRMSDLCGLKTAKMSAEDLSSAPCAAVFRGLRRNSKRIWRIAKQAATNDKPCRQRGIGAGAGA